MSPENISGEDPIQRIEPGASARKIAGLLIRTIGILVGAALAAGYLFMMWIAPPDFSHARPGAAIGMYIGLPLLFLFGPFWLADWFAAFVDTRRIAS